jgi:hypothetical protein
MKETPIPALKDTWGMALKVWWSFTWRVLISLAFGAAAAGFFIKFGPKYFHLKQSEAVLMASIAGGIYLFLITLAFIKGILNKRFKGFSVVIIKTH